MSSSTVLCTCLTTGLHYVLALLPPPRRLLTLAVNLLCALQPTCADTVLSSDTPTAYDCPDTYGLKANAASITNPNEANCCDVSGAW